MRIDPKLIEEHWPLTSVSIGREFRAYPTRRVFTIQSDQGAFAAKLDLAPVEGDSRERLYVLDYLAARGFTHAPALLPTRAGDRALQNSGQTICVLELVPDELVVSGASRELTWRELGEAAGRLNEHRDCGIPFAIPIGAALKELSARVAGRPFERPFLELLTRVAGLEHAPATSLIHGEINESNARRRDDGTVVLLDWDQAGNGPAVLEYGYPLVIAFLCEDDLSFDVRTAGAFYEGYLEGGGTIDRRHLFDAALFHALRYMWFGDVDQRWRRITHALNHEDEICSAL